MLSGNVTANLDHLATIGVIDYDAASYIAGNRPRFYGAPNSYTSPFVESPTDFTTFSYNQNPQQPTSWWKKILKYTLIIGGVYLGGKTLLKICKGVKYLSPKNWFSSGKKTPTTPTPTPAPKVSRFKKMRNSISNFWTNLVHGRKIKIPGRIYKF